MGKLHEAISKLREGAGSDDGSGGATQDRLDAVGSAASEGTVPVSLEQRLDTPLAIKALQNPDTLPNYAVIDDEDLRKTGLLPRGATSSAEFDQQFRRIKRPILSIAFGPTGQGIANSSVVMVASALPGSGKSFCSFQLARSIARERDIGVVYIDADVLKPSVSTAFRLEDSVGLMDFLVDPSTGLDDVVFRTGIRNCYVVPAGQQQEESTELLASQRMQQFLRLVSENFPSHAIVLDAPPLLVTNEAHVLAAHVGQIVLVVEAGATTRDSVMNALASLDRNKPINVILNKSRNMMAGPYGYSYSRGPEDQQPRGDSPPDEE